MRVGSMQEPSLQAGRESSRVSASPDFSPKTCPKDAECAARWIVST
jgi:hypothetical protein